MAARPWVTPEEVIQYTSHEDVLKRPVEKLAFDISRAELKVIAKTNNSFGEEYPEIPESVKMAVILLAEAYAKNSIEATKKQIRSETCRVYDSFANDLLLTFVPGRFNNDPTGWTVMEGLGRAILKAYQNDGAIQNVDEENDFLVDRGASTGDSVYISCGIQPVDSAEKYYFTVIAR